MVAQLLREASAALAPQARLSLAGEITRLARLAPLDYALERRSAAKQLGITADVLDDEVKKASQPETAAAGEDIGASKAPKDEPWDDAVDLCAALDAGLKELQRYVVAKETTLAVAAIWPAHAHLLDNDMVRLQRSPRLKIESRTPGSGKTTLLEVVIALSPRGRILSGYSASSVMRSIAKRHPTLGLDEGDRGIAGNNDLVQIIDAGDRRHTALVTRSIKLPDGNWGEEELDVFGPMAIAGIDELPGTAEERCVRVFLLRARYSEIRGALRDGTSPELVDVRRHLTAWAAAQTDLPEPKLPEELTRRAPRTVSNWQSLLAIADVAGGRWPALIQQAVLEEINAEREPSKLEQLLRGIKAAFDAQSNVVEGDRRAADDKNRIQTKTLLSYLLQDTSEEWGRANRGRAITAYFLREKLRGLLNPAGAQEWETGTRSRGSRQSHHGYERHQFEDPWARYLPPPSPPSSSETSAGSAGLEKMAETRHSGTPGGGVETPADPETSAEQEPASDPADTANPADAAEIPIDPGRQSKPSPSNLDQEKSASGADLNGDTNDPADPADVSDGRGEGKPGSDIDLIRAAKIQNPKWGRSKLATELGVSERKVRAALAGWELPEEPPAAPPEQETA